MKNTCIIVTALITLLALVVPVHAQSWSAAQTSGITLVTSSLDPMTNTYIWTLTNGSGQFDLPTVLIWSLEPFNVPAPIAWTAPAGWTWSGNGWQSYEITDSGEKYYAPPAVAPGQSVTFSYTFDPAAPKINPFGEGYIGSPTAIGFISHVAQVVPGSGTLDGSVRWTEDPNSIYGQTWFDRCIVEGDKDYPPVPEPSSIFAMMVGLTSLGGLLRRRTA